MSELGGRDPADMPEEWVDFHLSNMHDPTDEGDVESGYGMGWLPNEGIYEQGEQTGENDGYVDSGIYPSADDSEIYPPQDIADNLVNLETYATEGDTPPRTPEDVPVDISPLPESYLKSGAPLFTFDDKKAAGEAEWAFDEAFGNGGWFDCFVSGPQDGDRLEAAVAAHALGAEEFVDRVRLFGEFIDKARAFVDRPVVTVSSSANNAGDTFLDLHEYGLDASYIKDWTTFHNRLATYVGVLLANGPDAAETMAEAETLAKMRWPREWVLAGHELPEQPDLVGGGEPKNYFRRVLSQVTEPSKGEIDRMNDGPQDND
jgi:hypothetical protein